MIPAAAGAFVAGAVLYLLLLGASDAWHKVKHAGHAVGCAVERVWGHKCAPLAKPKPAPLASASDPLAVDADAARLLARKLELEGRLLVADTPELREEYTRVEREWGEAENKVMGIKP